MIDIDTAQIFPLFTVYSDMIQGTDIQLMANKKKRNNIITKKGNYYYRIRWYNEFSRQVASMTL